MPEWLGKTIGRVRIEKLLARGGMAEVYLGTHLTLERPVAIKLLFSQIEEEPAILKQFHREAKLIAGLRHLNIVQIFDIDTIDGQPYIVMEYLKGPTLATYLRYLHQRKKRLSFEQIASLLKGLTNALDYAHSQGVIHRDIKPGNIILHNRTDDIPLDQPLANNVEAIITDFGLVRIMNVASETVSGLVSGTPAYMSPEQARGDQIDQRTDLYSLGVVLYEMLAGRVPFGDDNTLTILHMHIHMPPPPIPGIPAKVQAVLDRAMAKSPNDRYRTSQEMVNDFYRSIGMSTQAAINRDPYPLTPVPMDVPPPTKLEPLPVSQPRSEPQPEPAPQAVKGQKGGYEVSEKQESPYNNKPGHNRRKPGRKGTRKLETSIAYPTLLSKRFASPFVLQYYFPQQRDEALKNIRAAFENSKINEYSQTSSVKLKQKIRVKFFSNAFDFSEPITREIDQEVNIFRFLGIPKDSCEPGFHKILISVSDPASGQEIESMTITAQVVDFAFDHMSRPLLSRISAVVLGMGSFVMFLLGLLEQIDQTVGLTTGTAAGILAAFVYGNFYNLYQRVRPTNT